MSPNRRRLLHSAALLAGGAAVGIDGARASAVPPRAAQEAGLAALGKALHGRLLCPGEEGFSVAAAPKASRWTDDQPCAVTICTGPEDV